jgi:hypothetical protein
MVSSNPKWQDSLQIHGADESKNRAKTEPLVVSSDPRWMHANQAGDGAAKDDTMVADEGAFAYGDGRV